MKKSMAALLCLVFLVSGCGKAEQSRMLQESYAAVKSAELTAEIICHLPEESRVFQVRCSYERDGESEITVTAPEELSGLQARVKGPDLSLAYDGLVLAAGAPSAVSAANCLPWLMRAAAEGYVLEEGHETLGQTACLRVAFDTTGEDGEKVLCAVWFDRETLAPVCAEFSADGQLRLTVKIIQFSAVPDGAAE